MRSTLFIIWHRSVLNKMQATCMQCSHLHQYGAA